MVKSVDRGVTEKAEGKTQEASAAVGWPALASSGDYAHRWPAASVNQSVLVDSASRGGKQIAR